MRINAQGLLVSLKIRFIESHGKPIRLFFTEIHARIAEVRLLFELVAASRDSAPR